MVSSSLDSLYAQVARKVLTESLTVKKGESVVVETWNTGLSFARQAVIEARKIGAIPITLFEDEEAYVQGVRKGDRDSLGTMGKHELSLLSNTDAYVFIPGPVIGAYSKKLKKKEVADSTRYNASWYEVASKAKLRGARLPFGHIDEDASKVLGKPVREIVTNQLRAALIDFEALGKKAKELASYLQDGTEVKLVTPGAELKFVLRGEVEINDGVVDQDDIAAENNMTYVPPGNVYKEVEVSSANGTVRLSPTTTGFGIFKDASMEFENGRLVKWSSKSSKKVLDQVIEAAADQMKTVSGFFIGLNPALGYGYALNTLSAGVVGIRCAGIVGTTNQGMLSVGGRTVVANGRLK